MRVGNLWDDIFFPVKAFLADIIITNSESSALISENRYSMGLDPETPFFCIYKNPIVSSDSGESKKRPDLLMAVYKNIDQMNTENLQNVKYKWIIKFFVDPVDECDDTPSGKIRDLIDLWKRDEQLCDAFARFLCGQITSPEALKEFINSLYLAFNVSRRLDEEDYRGILIFFIQRIKNNFLMLAQEKKESLFFLLTGHPNPAVYKKPAVLDEVMNDLSDTTLLELIRSVDRLQYLLEHVAPLPDEYLSRIFELFFKKQKLPDFIRRSDIHCVVDNLILIVTSHTLSEEWQEKIWESIRHHIIHAIQNVDQFIRILAVPFLESKEKRLAFMSACCRHLELCIHNEFELRRFMRSFHFSEAAVDVTLRDFIWKFLINKLSMIIRMKIDRGEGGELDAFLSSESLTESERIELRSKIIEAGWVASAAHVTAVYDSSVLLIDEKEEAMDNVASQYGTPPPHQLPGRSDSPPASTISREVLDPTPSQRVAALFESVVQFIDLFNRAAGEPERRRVFLDALKLRFSNATPSGQDVLLLLDECDLAPLERDEIWAYLKLPLFQNIIDGNDSFELLSSAQLTEIQYQELLAKLAPHHKKIMPNLDCFMKFYDGDRLSPEYRQQLLNSFKKELILWVHDANSLLDLLNFGFSDDKLEPIWNCVIQHVINVLIQKASVDDLIEIIDCCALSQRQRDLLCGSQALICACVNTITELVALIQTGKLNFSQQDKIFSMLGFSKLKKMIYPIDKNSDSRRLNYLVSSDYLDFSIPFIKRVILSERGVFDKWCEDLDGKIKNAIDIDDILPEDVELISRSLKLLRLEYVKRILVAPLEEVSSCSFFSRSENIPSLKEKMAAIDQLLDEIEERQPRTSEIAQYLIDKKKRNGRLAKLSKVWGEAKTNRDAEKCAENQEAPKFAVFSPR